MVKIWAHTSPTIGHPGVHQMPQILQTWWPNMLIDITKTMLATSWETNATFSIHYRLYHRPPNTQNNTDIMIIIYWFSKPLHFSPLSKWPSTFETAEHLSTCVQIVWYPKNIIFDKGTKFMSSFWGSFIEELRCQWVSHQANIHSQLSWAGKPGNWLAFKTLLYQQSGGLFMVCSLGWVCT